MERIKLNLIPSGVAPIVHLSQYDDGRKFGIDLFEGESVYVLDGTETLTVNSRKPDGHVVVLTVTNTGTSSLDVDTVEQLTAVHGVSYAKLQIVKGSVTIATLPFLIDVSRDPLENGDPSESFIQNLHTQIAEGVAEEVATQYDSENVIFDEEPTDNHGIGYTVTSEGIKTAIDNAFDYDNTASGSIVHITDGADNIPVKSLVSQIVATGGGGTPDAPIAINGFDSGIITRCGVNLIKKQALMQPVHLASGTTIYTKLFNFSGQFNLYGLKKGLPDISTNWTVLLSMGSSLRSVTLTDDYEYIGISSGAYSDLGSGDMQVSLAPFSDFSAYNGNTYTFTFGQTVYGGHFDNKGNLVVTHGIISDLGSLSWGGSDGQFNYSFTVIPKNWNRNSETWGKCSALKVESWLSVDLGTQSNNSIHGLAFNAYFILRVYASDYSTAEELKTALSGQSLIYELDNPITLSITSQDIPTLLGENNIYSNCGDVEVNYYTNKSNDILDFIDSEIGKKNGTNIPIEENSQDSIKNYIDNEVSTITTSLSNKADKTEDGTITIASGCTLISSSCGKTDRLVHLNFNVEKTGGFTTGWQVVGTTDFKPNTLAYCPLWNVTNGVGNGEVRIDTDGTINFYVVTAGEVRLNANIGYVTS